MLDAIEIVAKEQDYDAALNHLSRKALELTGSRCVMLATFNDELGVLEIHHGAGEEFERVRKENLRLPLEAEMGIVSHVAMKAKAFRTGDVSREPIYNKLFDTTVSELAAPVFDVYGRVRAVLNCESDLPNSYGEAHESIAMGIALLASLVIERQESLRREEALIKIGIGLSTALSEESLVEQVMSVARQELRYNACSLFLYESERERYVLKGSSSILKDRVNEITYEANEGCTGWVCANGEPILLNGPQSDPRWRGRYTEFPPEEIAAFLAVPILQRGKSIGAIRIIRRVTENKYLDNRFTPNDERMMEAIARQFSTCLTNLRNLETVVRGERMIAWGELSAKSSHMIGNRVFAVKGDVNELKHILSSGPRPGELEELQESLSKNVIRIEEILQEFRDFVGATQLNKHDVDINALVRESVEEVFPKHGDLKLEWDLQENVPHMQADSRKLRRAISELVENSVHHNIQGSLKIRTSLETGRPSKIRIVVEDTGPGVEKERKESIFQPFKSTRVKGLGLGLSIVKGIADAHGGQVFEDGKEGQGARFVILLPVEDRP